MTGTGMRGGGREVDDEWSGVSMWIVKRNISK